MKRVFSFLLFFFMTCILLAQEKVQEAEEVLDNSAEWSTETKMSLLAVWGLVVLVLTARTFRNKSDM
ncbi:MAG: hypothetical protein R8G66_10565 [Cytophagales bacterium]|nr:hypothetical protein [Cytophagales bacterium]